MITNDGLLATPTIDAQEIIQEHLIKKLLGRSFKILSGQTILLSGHDLFQHHEQPTAWSELTSVLSIMG